MDPVTTTLVGTTDIQISWVAPASNGLSITGYKVQLFVPTTLGYVDDATYCTGLGAAATSCTFPITTLLTTYSFSKGDLVQARVRASNSKGNGGYSTLNTVGATVQTVPKAMNAPIKAGTSTSTQLDITWSGLTSTSDTGASAITSYNLEWDQGLGTSVYTELVGETTPYTTTSYSKTSLTPGTSYKFRLRAKNALGWGDYSSITTMTPYAAPSQMTAVTTTVVGSNVQISWTAPTSNGASITAYKILIAQSDGSAYTETTAYCDGTDPQIISDLKCSVPMTVLTSSPYSLTYGTLVAVKA